MKKQLFLLLLSSIALFAQAPNISYPAGTYTFGIGTTITPLSPTNSGGAVPATIYGQVSSPFVAASFSSPSGVSVDSVGNVYVADTMNNKIRKITPLGMVTTFAASFNNPYALTIDSADNLYVSDTNGTRILKITPVGVRTIFAVGFNDLRGISTDTAGNVYVAETGNNRILKITPAGVVTTFAGSGMAGSVNSTGIAASFNSPEGISIDLAGNAYVADTGNNMIRKITPAGVVYPFAGSRSSGSADGIAASFNSPVAVEVDNAGNVFVVDSGNLKVRKISPAGVVTTFAGSGYYGSADGTGTAASFNSPSGIYIDSAGNVYIADSRNNKIRKITLEAVVTTLAGTGIPELADGIAEGFNAPTDVVFDSADNMYVADMRNNKIRKVTPEGVVTTFAGSGTAGSADGTGTAASFNAPRGLAVDTAGNIYVADSGNYKIRKITPVGIVSTFAGSGISGSTNATGAIASFLGPSSLAIDLTGNIFVTDNISVNNNNNFKISKIRKISPTGVVTTLAGSDTPSTRYTGAIDGVGTAASFFGIGGIVIDSSGNLYVTDTGNHKIRKITLGGVVTTFAGNSSFGNIDGIGIAASFNSPSGLTIDNSDNICISEYNTIRKMTLTGVVTTLAGSSSSGSADGIGTVASFNNLLGVAFDSKGNVYVADTGNNKIRKISATGYVINPVLMAGLNFESTTGKISGTPSASSAATSYTITAYNATGSSSTTVVIATSTLGTTTFNKQELKLYPNPVNTLLHIQSPNNIILDKVNIVNLTGKKVLEQTQNTSQVDVVHLANGMYIIEAFSGKEKFLSKFMKE